jgi:hypothetical protein
MTAAETPTIHPAQEMPDFLGFEPLGRTHFQKRTCGGPVKFISSQPEELHNALMYEFTRCMSKHHPERFRGTFRAYMLDELYRFLANQESLTYMEWEREHLRKNGITLRQRWYFKRIHSSLPDFLPFPEGEEPQTGFEPIFTVQGMTWGLVDRPTTWRENLRTLFRRKGKDRTLTPLEFKDQGRN